MNVNILLVVLYLSFPHSYHWGKLRERLLLFLTTAWQSISVKKTLQNPVSWRSLGSSWKTKSHFGSVPYRKTSYDEAIAALWKSRNKRKSNTLPLNGGWGSSRLGGDQTNLMANLCFMWWRPPLRSFPRKHAQWEPDLLTVQHNPETWVSMWNSPNFLLNTVNTKPNSSESQVATCIFPSHPHQQPSRVGLDPCFLNGVKQLAQGGPLIGGSSAALTGRPGWFCLTQHLHSFCKSEFKNAAKKCL